MILRIWRVLKSETVQPETEGWLRTEVNLKCLANHSYLVVSNICLFSPLKLGGMIQFDEHIFQGGWFNQQLDRVVCFNFLFETTSWVVVCYWKLQTKDDLRKLCKVSSNSLFYSNKSKDLKHSNYTWFIFPLLYGVGLFSLKNTPKKTRFPIPFPSVRKDASLANVSRVHWTLAHNKLMGPRAVRDHQPGINNQVFHQPGIIKLPNWMGSNKQHMYGFKFKDPVWRDPANLGHFVHQPRHKLNAFFFGKDFFTKHCQGLLNGRQVLERSKLLLRCCWQFWWCHTVTPELC